MQKINIKHLRISPHNPRKIDPEKLDRLKKSLADFPQMLELRPLVIKPIEGGKYEVLGGNMRLRALKELGIKEVPCRVADNLTEEQEQEFMIKDNVGFGDWDFEALQTDWDMEELAEWGLDLPILQIEEEPNLQDLIGEEQEKDACIKITFEDVSQMQRAENDIQELLNRLYPNAYYSVSAGKL